MSFETTKIPIKTLKDNPWMEYVVRCKIALRAYTSAKDETAKRLLTHKQEWNGHMEEHWNRQSPLRSCAENIDATQAHLLFLEQQRVSVLEECLESVMKLVEVQVQKHKYQAKKAEVQQERGDRAKISTLQKTKEAQAIDGVFKEMIGDEDQPKPGGGETIDTEK